MNNLKERFNNFKEDPIIDQLREYLENTPGKELFHIDVYSLADRWDIERKILLDFFIQGIKYNIFTLQWEYHCPKCGGVARESLNIKDSHTEDHCPICNIDFANALDENIEVFFSITEELKSIPMAIKKDYMEKIKHDVMHNGMHKWKNAATIKGIDCINNAVFRELFDDDTLALDQSLEINRSTIFFTDIKGSTAMYEKFGDSKTFQLVREHFNILFKAILKYNGVPVKTIGDAVMGVFIKEEDSLKSALEAQVAFKTFNESRNEEEKIEVKIGIYSGPSIVVTLNNKLDYFGSTVNKAARIQGLSRPNEVLFSEEIFNNPKTKHILKQYVNKVYKFKTKLKGLKDDYLIYKAIL